ncbi:hypothetical protein [Pyrobaculum aerophilum]|nr:hypothetical protein [Pyrobaculum aerophilum]
MRLLLERSGVVELQASAERLHAFATIREISFKAHREDVLAY